jgi:hypothetical protein
MYVQALTIIRRSGSCALILLIIVTLLIGSLAPTQGADKDIDFTVGSVKAKSGKKTASSRSKPKSKATPQYTRQRSSGVKTKSRSSRSYQPRKKRRRARIAKRRWRPSTTVAKKPARKSGGGTLGTTNKTGVTNQTTTTARTGTGNKQTTDGKTAINLTGTWQTTDGWTVHLTQKGMIVTGNYSGDDVSGTLRGTLKDTTLATTFQHRQGGIAFSGTMNLSYSPEDDTLNGRWSAGDFGEPISAARISR